MLQQKRDVNTVIEKNYSGDNESVESIVADMEADVELAAAAASLGKEGAINISDVEALADSAPVRKLLNMVLLLAIKDHASDLHFEPFRR